MIFNILSVSVLIQQRRIQNPVKHLMVYVCKKACNYSHKNAPSSMFGWVLNTPLTFLNKMVDDISFSKSVFQKFKKHQFLNILFMSISRERLQSETNSLEVLVFLLITFSIISCCGRNRCVHPSGDQFENGCPQRRKPFKGAYLISKFEGAAVIGGKRL